MRSCASASPHRGRLRAIEYCIFDCTPCPSNARRPDADTVSNCMRGLRTRLSRDASRAGSRLPSRVARVLGTVGLRFLHDSYPFLHRSHNLDRPLHVAYSYRGSCAFVVHSCLGESERGGQRERLQITRGKTRTRSRLTCGAKAGLTAAIFTASPPHPPPPHSSRGPAPRRLGCTAGPCCTPWPRQRGRPW